MMKHFLAVSICVRALAACGGGGSGGGSSRDVERMLDTSDWTRKNTRLKENPLESDYASATRALRQNILSHRFNPLDAEGENHFRNTADEDLLDSDPRAFQPIHDTNAQAAWRLGWTGRGTKIGVLDGFNLKNTLGIRDKISHGNAVSFVAQQVAPEAEIATQPLPFGCNRPDGQFERQVAAGNKYFEANGYHIVNNSWGFDRYFHDSCANKPNPRLLPIGTWQALITAEKQDLATKSMAAPLSDDGAYNANMLFIFAAGNDGRVCPGGIGECNLLAATIDSMRQDDGIANAGARVLFVDALRDESLPGTLFPRTTRLARYSHPAGDMVNDYIVAHDDIYQYGKGSGTSFAAPRVAGAAALVRHKFPSLNGPNLKQVMLRSADDLGEKGPDEIYGHGKLNVLSALSPIDGLTK